jgi:cytochrome c biogenesis protein CcdA
MTAERIVRIVAGFFIMLSLALAHFSGTVDMTQASWLWFTAFVGFNLFQSGLTRFCPLDAVLKKAGVPQGCGQ